MARWALSIAVLVGLVFATEELYRAGYIRFNYPNAVRYPVRGIDVSHHQGRIDWAAVATAGVDFAFIKATEGADHLDTRFQENWAAAGTAGVARSSYHFFTFCSPGALQATHFLSVVADLPRELPAAVDVEFSGNCSSWTSIDAIREELAVFLDAVAAALGSRPVVYFDRESHARLTKERAVGENPLWIRGLLFEPSRGRYGNWAFWQYADNARLDGIRGPVDLNVFCCDRERFGELDAR